MITSILCLSATGWSAEAQPNSAKPSRGHDPADHVYQYLVLDEPTDPKNSCRSFLWIPPDCPRINGLFLAPKNMCEQTFLEFSETRNLCRELGLAVMILMPAKTSPFVVDAFPDLYTDPKKSGQKIFNYRDGAIAHLQRILDLAAQQSGYPELAWAPMIFLSHSWAGSFASHAAYGMPDRTICTIPLKTHLEGGSPFDPEASAAQRLKGVPALMVDEQPGPNLGKSSGWDSWDFRQSKARNARTNGDDTRGNPISRLVPLGSGHVEMPTSMMHLMVDYVRAACARRLPAVPPSSGPPTLQAVDLADGWLVDDRLDQPVAKTHPTAPWKAYTGNRQNAIWYFNERLARDMEAYFRSRFERPHPQAIAFIDPATGTPLVNPDVWRITIPRLADDGTFTVSASPLEACTSPWYMGCGPLAKSTAPMEFSVVMGEVEQVGPNQFRVVRDRFGPGGCGRTLQVVNAGDAKTQPATHSVMVNIAPVVGGAGQRLTFPKLPDITVATTSVPLQAVSDAGLPIAYYVVEGPAVVDGSTLRITQIPRRAALPMQVTVAAYQTGRYGEKPVQPAGPAERKFQIMPR